MRRTSGAAADSQGARSDIYSCGGASRCGYDGYAAQCTGAADLRQAHNASPSPHRSDRAIGQHERGVIVDGNGRNPARRRHSDACTGVRSTIGNGDSSLGARTIACDVAFNAGTCTLAERARRSSRALREGLRRGR